MLSVSSRLSLAITTHLGHSSAPGVRAGPNLLKALKAHLAKYAARRFNITAILIDGESGVTPIIPDIQKLGIEVNPVAAGDHVSVAERKIKTIKERTRGKLSTCAYRVCKSLLIGLVMWSTAVVNAAPAKGGIDGVCPTEAFLGRKVDMLRDFRTCWGAYCETTEPVSATIKNRVDVARTRPCIALFPTGNANGSWVFYALDTMKLITRSSWKELPPRLEIIQRLNSIHDAELQNPSRYPSIDRGAVGDILFDTLGPEDVPDALRDGFRTHADQSVPVGTNQFTENQPFLSIGEAFHPVADEEIDTHPLGWAQPDTARPESDPPPKPDYRDEPYPDTYVSASNSISDRGDEPQSASKQKSLDTPASYRRFTTRSGIQYGHLVLISAEEMSNIHSVVERGDFTLMTQDPHSSGPHEYCLNLSPTQALKKNPEEAAKSIYAEISQLDDKLVFHPIDPKNLTVQARKSAIRSSMFLKEKFAPDGTFEKLKARLVAGGNLQDRSLYYDEDISSPTASLTSVFMIAAIAANEKRKVVTIDITGAYLHAALPKGPDAPTILMRLNKIEAQFLVKKRPDYAKFLLPDGTMIVELDKALYGLIESARLWFKSMSDTLKKDGFISNAYDICVFNKIVDGKQITVVLYVDDLFLTSCQEKAIDDLIQLLTDKYRMLTVRPGPIVNYLGMTLDFSVQSSVKITMKGYIDEVLQFCGTTGVVSSPAAPNLFDINPDADKLDLKLKAEFHSRVMKLFYLAKRVRPDLLLAIQFLTTRVLTPDEDDWKKLERCLKYLNGTRELGVMLEANGDLNSLVVAYIDASFGVHHDGKSQSACTITLGKGSTYAKASKQKMNTKSSHESELIALSDGGGQVLWSREFLLEQGYKIGPAIVFQDNMSTIQSIQKGRPCGEKSRHINLRYFWLKDRVESGEILIKYLPSEDMIADILTKPLQGELFRKLRAKLLNWSM